ncbi:hypothetical protein Tco_1045617 [Tanacetum coccineum]|uniref:Uncharacterized protein n=1 Tax=Tanacetum coccineum TaxID=301880 RepID=A0ABQ5GVH7_9ASTR
MVARIEGRRKRRREKKEKREEEEGNEEETKLQDGIVRPGTISLNIRIGDARLGLAMDRWSSMGYMDNKMYCLSEVVLTLACLLLSFFSFQFIYFPSESFVMSLDNSDNLDIPDVDPLDPALEATTLPKFDMHLYKSSLNETHVKWLIKCYKILEELHPRVVSERITMDELPNDAIGLAIGFPSRVGLEKVVNHALKMLLLGYKLAVGTLLPPGTAQVTHLTPPANRLEDIPLRTGDMVVAEMPYPPCHENVDEHMANGGAGNEHGDENIVDDWWAIRAAHATEPRYPISRMELYIENRENGRMILNFVLNGLLVWPTVDEENGTTRTKKYEELSVAEKLQADCDLKATNIVLQGLPPDVYAIVNLMQDTKLSLQEKECKLYDEFDKFSFVKGLMKTLYHYYRRDLYSLIAIYERHQHVNAIVQVGIRGSK